MRRVRLEDDFSSRKVDKNDLTKALAADWWHSRFCLFYGGCALSGSI
jgi:hypothetical protein